MSQMWQKDQVQRLQHVWTSHLDENTEWSIVGMRFLFSNKKNFTIRLRNFENRMIQANANSSESDCDSSFRVSHSSISSPSPSPPKKLRQTTLSSKTYRPVSRFESDFVVKLAAIDSLPFRVISSSTMILWLWWIAIYLITHLVLLYYEKRKTEKYRDQNETFGLGLGSRFFAETGSRVSFYERDRENGHPNCDSDSITLNIPHMDGNDYHYVSTSDPACKWRIQIQIYRFQRQTTCP